MNFLSFIAAVLLTITLIEGIYILTEDPASKTNQIFFLICASMALWLLGGVFGYSAPTSDEAFLWFKVASPGFIFMHALVLHFTLRYTGRCDGSNFFPYLIYVPSFIFLYISITGTLVFSDIYLSNGFWAMVPDYNSLSFYFFMVNYLGYYGISLYFLYPMMRSSGSMRIRSQSKILFAAIVLTIASYNIEPFLAPLFFNYHTYGQAPLYSIVWVSLIWYAMKTYRFLGVYERFLPKEILDSLPEMVIIMDTNFRIMDINGALKKILQGGGEPKLIEDLFIEHELLKRLITLNNDNSIPDITLNLIDKTGTVMVNAAVSVFKDRFDDIVGYIIIAHKIEEREILLKKNGITEREYDCIKLIIAGNSNKEIGRALGITLRTVETHITNIFNKLGFNKRSELVNYCSDLFMKRK